MAWKTDVRVHLNMKQQLPVFGDSIVHATETQPVGIDFKNSIFVISNLCNLNSVGIKVHAIENLLASNFSNSK